MNKTKMNQTNICSERERLIYDLRMLANLLEDPEPGLCSWYIACEQTAQRIRAGITVEALGDAML